MNITTRKWNRKKVTGLLACLSAYAACIYWLGCQSVEVAWRGFEYLVVLTGVLAIVSVWRPLKLFVLILSSCLFVSQAQTQERDENVVPECGVFVVVVGVGVILYLGIKKLCKKLPPPNRDPQQPPASGTNHLAGFGGSPSTFSLPPLGDSNVEAYDVSSCSFWNSDPNGQPYTVWFTCVIESSTNLSNWRTECTVNGWKSSTTIALVLSDENDRPVCTNFVSASSSSVTGEVASLVASEDRKFFRVR